MHPTTGSSAGQKVGGGAVCHPSPQILFHYPEVIPALSHVDIENARSLCSRRMTRVYAKRRTVVMRA